MLISMSNNIPVGKPRRPSCGRYAEEIEFLLKIPNLPRKAYAMHKEAQKFVKHRCFALIVPQELPSILSLVYSTIPQVRKGTDSRLGFGFRLGEHADFQVMFELGPQKDTKPIGIDSYSNSKRHISSDEYDKAVENSPNKEGTSYLMNWSQDMFAKKSSTTTNNPDVVNGMNSIVQITPLISESALKQLQLLYKMAHKETANNSAEITGPLPVAAQQLVQPSYFEDHKSQQKLGNRKPPSKDKDKITADLMDVSLD